MGCCWWRLLCFSNNHDNVMFKPRDVNSMTSIPYPDVAEAQNTLSRTLSHRDPDVAEAQNTLSKTLSHRDNKGHECVWRDSKLLQVPCDRVIAKSLLTISDSHHPLSMYFWVNKTWRVCTFEWINMWGCHFNVYQKLWILQNPRIGWMGMGEGDLKSQELW